MSSFEKNQFMQTLPQLQFSEDKQQTWNRLEQGIRQSALQVDDDSQLPLATWWTQSFELLAPRQVVISEVHYDQDEYIQISNKGPAIIDISGWKINAGNDGQDMTFPEGTLLQSDQSVKIFTAPGEDFTFNSKLPIWNNKGDTGYLYNSEGTLISSWVYGIQAHQAVAISHIHYDGQEKYTEGDEYAEILNLGEHQVDLSAWTLSAGRTQDFHFPQQSVIAPGARIRVYTNKVDSVTGGYSFGSKTAIWNNKGDTGILSDYQGNQVSEFRYGTF